MPLLTVLVLADLRYTDSHKCTHKHTHTHMCHPHALGTPLLMLLVLADHRYTDGPKPTARTFCEDQSTMLR